MKKFKMAWSRSEKKHRKPIEKETEFGFEVESLESRQMLAGNVDVVVSGDNMIINGDSDGNHIAIWSQVDTIGVLGSHGTTVTGDVFDLTVADLNKLTINMKGGNDSIMVGPRITAAGKVRVTGAAGDDYLVFLGTAQDRLQIIGGGGTDVLGVSGTFNDKVTLSSGGGIDQLLVSGTFHDKVTLNGGAGDDLTGIYAATFATDVKANMGHGADEVYLHSGVSFADARFNLGSGDDVLVMRDTITGEPIFNGGGGFDTSNPDPDGIPTFYPNVTLKSFEGRQ